VAACGRLTGLTYNVAFAFAIVTFKVGTAILNRLERTFLDKVCNPSEFPTIKNKGK
jgi:hypothetical protein